MSRASKILSPSPLDCFSCGDFFGPLNKVGEGRGLSFRFGGMKSFYLNFQRQPKVGAQLNLFQSATMPVHACESLVQVLCIAEKLQRSYVWLKS